MKIQELKKQIQLKYNNWRNKAKNKATVSKELAAEINHHCNCARSLSNKDASDNLALSSVYLNNDASDSETEANSGFQYKPMCKKCGFWPWYFTTAIPFFTKIVPRIAEHIGSSSFTENGLMDATCWHLLCNYQCTQIRVSNFSAKLSVEPCILHGVWDLCLNSKNKYKLDIEQLFTFLF
jgi:hypothetical protein